MRRLATLSLCLLLPLLALPAVAEAAAMWLTPVTISDAGQSATSHQVAVDPQGNAIAVWRRSDGVKIRIQAAVRPAGGSFGVAQTISDAGETANAPQVATDPAGNAIAVWYRSDGANNRIQAAVRPAGGSFGAAQTISDAGRPAYMPRVAVDPQGNAVATWYRYDGANTRIQAAVRPAGGSFGAPQTISDAGQDAYSNRLAVDPQGNAVAVWNRSDGANNRIEAAVRPAGGSFGAAQTISDAGKHASFPEVAVDPQGNAVAVWTRSDGVKTRIQAAVRPAGGSFGAAQTISDAGQDATVPHVAMDPQGNAVAVWTRSDGANSRIQAAVRPVGGSFGAAQTLSDAGGSADGPQVAADPEGNAIAVWDRSDGVNIRIQAAVRPVGGSFGAAQTLSDADQNAYQPRVATDPQGNAVAVWYRSDGANNRIQVAGYDATAPTLSGLSIPGQGSVGSSLSFSVTAFDAWSQVTTVWSFGDGAQASGALASHVYSAAGTYPVSVTATDTVGNVSTTAGSVSVSASSGPTPPGPTPPDTTAPAVSSFSLNRRRFRAGSKSTPSTAKRKKKRKSGTTFRYKLSEAATVKITIRKRTRGRRVGNKCRKATKKRRRRKRCTRYVRVGTLTRTAKAGTNRTRFTGRIGRRKLRGRYRATITATDAAGNASKRRRASFTVTRR